MKKFSVNAAIFLLVLILCWLFVSKILSHILHIPNDPCYYETHHAPDWIVRYYMDDGYHVAKEGNLFLLLLMILTSGCVTLLIIILRRTSAGVK
jgi:hypothetical protein